MLAAPTFGDFIRFAARRPVMVTMQLNFGEQPRFFMEEGRHQPVTDDLLDSDATRVLNGVAPFRLLKQAALSEPLPAGLRQEALMTAFTRGLMLGEDLLGIAKAVGDAAYLNARDDDGRRFAAAFLILHHPEARPFFATGITRQSRPGRLDSFRDNW